MKRMFFPQECDQRVDVKQSDAHDSSLSISSLSFITCSAVTAPAGPGEKMRIPFSHFVGTSALKPRSRISETPAPCEMERAEAFSFSFSRTSFLISRVVRIRVYPPKGSHQ